MVGAQRVRIDQHAVVAVHAVAHADDRQLLSGAAPMIEVAPPALDGDAGRAALEHRGGQLAQPVAAGKRVEHGIRVGVLRVDPGPGRRRVLVLQPAVGVADRDAVERVDDLADRGARRCPPGRLDDLGAALPSRRAPQRSSAGAATADARGGSALRRRRRPDRPPALQRGTPRHGVSALERRPRERLNPPPSHLPEQEAHRVDHLVDLLADRLAAGVPRLRVVAQQDGVVRPVLRLHQRRHLAGVERRHAGVAVAREIQGGRVVAALDHVVVRRVGVDVRELLGVVARAVLRHPEAGHEELVVAHHVEQRIGADDRPEQVGPLVRDRADEEAAVAAAADGEVLRARVAGLDQVLGRGDEVVEDVLLVGEHPGLVPLLAELAAAAHVRQREDAAGPQPGGGEGREARRLAQVEAAVAGQQGRVPAVERHARPVHDEHRHAGAVLRGEPALRHPVGRRVHRQVGLGPDRLLARGHVVAVDGARDVERLEGEERLVAGPAPGAAPDRADGVERDVAHVRPVELVDRDPRLDVLEVRDGEPAAERRRRLDDDVVPLRDHLPPAVGRRVAGIGQHDALVRGIEVGHDDELAPCERGPRLGDAVGDGGDERRVVREVLHVDLGRARGALDDVHDHPAPVVGDDGDRDLVALVPGAEELDVVGHRRPERVVHDARRHVAVALVVEAAPVRRERHRAVAGRRQHVGEVVAAVDAADADGDLVDAPLADRVGHPPAVVRDVAQLDAGRVVRAHRMRIDEHPFGAVEPVSEVEDGEVLVGAAAAVEVAPAPLVRQPDRLALEDRRRHVPQPVAAGQGAEHGVRVRVLRVDPGPRLRRLLVLEPAVRIGHVDAVQGVDDFPDFGRRWRRHGDSLLRAGRGGEERRAGDPCDGSQSGHGGPP